MSIQIAISEKAEKAPDGYDPGYKPAFPIPERFQLRTLEHDAHHQDANHEHEAVEQMQRKRNERDKNDGDAAEYSDEQCDIRVGPETKAE